MKRIIKSTLSKVVKAWEWYANQYCRLYMPPII
jgi:hypothetical protein